MATELAVLIARGRQAAADVAAFAGWERRTQAPLIRFELLRVRSLRAATLAVGLNAVGFTAIVFVGTLYLQEGLGYSAWESALAVVPIDLASLLVALAARDYVAPLATMLLAADFAGSALALGWLAREADQPGLGVAGLVDRLLGALARGDAGLTLEAAAGLDDVGRDQTQRERQHDHREEVGERAQREPAREREVPERGDAEHHREAR